MPVGDIDLYIYDLVYNNINLIINNTNYYNIFNPNNNNLTKRFLNSGYNIYEAYAMSISATIVLYKGLKE